MFPSFWTCFSCPAQEKKSQQLIRLMESLLSQKHKKRRSCGDHGYAIHTRFLVICTARRVITCMTFEMIDPPSSSCGQRRTSRHYYYHVQSRLSGYENVHIRYMEWAKACSRVCWLESWTALKNFEKKPALGGERLNSGEFFFLSSSHISHKFRRHIFFIYTYVHFYHLIMSRWWWRTRFRI